MALPAIELVATTRRAGHFRFVCMWRRVLALRWFCLWEVRAAAFGGFTTFSGDVRVHGWCLIAGTGISSAMAGRAGRRFSCLGVRLERWMLIALTLEWRGVS
jgi:hypothetical protein